MTAAQPAISVIVATRGLRERAELLDEAITSIIEQADVRAIPLIVLNGTRRCPSVERKLASNERVQLIVLEEAGLPAALAAGRAAVQTPWFANLDDDDILLPGALATRLEALQSDENLDVVVTNGYQRDDSGDKLNLPGGAAALITADPLRALLDHIWLLPGSWLCRTDRVPVNCFAGMPSYLECTFLAALFATEYRMSWLAEPTVVYRVGSPLAESRSRAYVVGQAGALQQILRLDLPSQVRRGLRRRVTGSYHFAAEYDRKGGRLADAWRWHGKSLLNLGGWRYLLYTRHLLYSRTGRPE